MSRQRCVWAQVGAFSDMTEFSMPPEEQLDFLLEMCKRAGASDADARLITSESESVDVRNGQLETIERSESAGVSLRCLFGKQQASVSGTDLSKDGLAMLAERCASMAKVAPEDPYCGVLEERHLATDIPEFDLAGDADNSPNLLEAEALEAEAAAMSVPGIKQVASCGAGWSRSERWVASSNGFRARKAGGSSGISLTALAEKDGAMERDYAGRSSRRRADRLAPAEIGRLAAKRTLDRLGPVKVESQTAAVIYDQRVSTRLLNAFMNAISGPAIARGVSFLKDRLGEQVFAPGVDIYDDPFRPLGMATRGHDGEGMAVSKTRIVSEGTLTCWLLNGPSARQLGLEPNGFGGMGFGDPPSVSTSNVYMAAGVKSVADMMSETGKGLLVTDMFGPSINPNSGDYSVGVSGLWYENGEVAYPVSEVTIAGDLPSMFARLVPANDLEFLGKRDAPSLLVEGMTIAGS